MTIVCYKDGVLAADGLSCRGSIIVSRAVKKIQWHGGMLAAGAGDSTKLQRVHNWLKENYRDSELRLGGVLPLPTPEDDDMCMLLVWPDRRLMVYSKMEIGDVSDELTIAIGEGENLARGAMLMGASAFEAVKLCTQNNVYCGGEIQVELVELLAPTLDDIDDYPLFAELPAEEPLRPASWKEKNGLE